MIKIKQDQAKEMIARYTIKNQDFERQSRMRKSNNINWIRFIKLYRIKDGEVYFPCWQFNEYFDAWFLKNFDICEFEECFDPYSAEKVDGNIYPGFFIIKAQKRK